MYNTADDLESLDITEELLSFDTVLGVEEHHQIFDEEFKDADYRIVVRDFSEIEKIKSLLLPLCYKAYVDDDETVIKIENASPDADATNDEIVKQLNKLELADKLAFIRDHAELQLLNDNGWFWVERNGLPLCDDEGNDPEGFGELFTSSGEMEILLSMAGL